VPGLLSSSVFAHLFELLHHLRMARPFDTRFFRGAVQFRVDVVSTLAAALLRFDLHGVSVGPGIVSNAGYLPGHFDIRLVSSNSKFVSGDLAADDGLSELSHDGQLIAEITIGGFKPFRHCDDGISVVIGDDISIVEIDHVGRLKGRLREVLVGGVQRMVDPGYDVLRVNASGGEDVTVKIPGCADNAIAGGVAPGCVNSISAKQRTPALKNSPYPAFSPAPPP
jgi:hypothetical protein